nr:MAG TPA: hypothetical protein [Caudoviricetes sp.]
MIRGFFNVQRLEGYTFILIRTGRIPQKFIQY